MKSYIFVTFIFSLLTPAYGQSLKELLKLAEANYPLLKAKGHEVQARRDQVSFVKSSALPTVDAAYQLNYATYNNITGMAVGQSFVPISGPPSTKNVYSPVFGSVAGLLLNWEPITFGHRKSMIESATAYADYQEADANNERFQHQIRTTSAYLDVIMTQEMIKVHVRNVERSLDNARIIRSLTESGLRPGTDTALFSAELSRARIELYNYEQLKAAQEVALSEFLGGSSTYSLDSSFFTRLPGIPADTAVNNHPQVRLAAGRLLIGAHERKALQRTLYPKLSLWGTAYARGSGISYDGYVNSQDGLSFSRYNYGAGLVLSAPLLRVASLRHQVHSQESIIKADEEKLNHTRLQLEKQRQVADVTLTNALKIARETPLFLQSAQFSYRALRSRYNSGLINYGDYIQAQYLLIKSEVDLKRAYIDAWKALLYKAAVHGDIDIFLNQLN